MVLLDESSRTEADKKNIVAADCDLHCISVRKAEEVCVHVRLCVYVCVCMCVCVCVCVCMSV